MESDQKSEKRDEKRGKNAFRCRAFSWMGVEHDGVRVGRTPHGQGTEHQKAVGICALDACVCACGTGIKRRAEGGGAKGTERAKNEEWHAKTRVRARHRNSWTMSECTSAGTELRNP
eukprot:6175182-Pleurochrysis_carterae.AAC.2